MTMTVCAVLVPWYLPQHSSPPGQTHAAAPLPVTTKRGEQERDPKWLEAENIGSGSRIFYIAGTLQIVDRCSEWEAEIFPVQLPRLQTSTVYDLLEENE